MTIRPPPDFQTQPEEIQSAMPDISEPVLKASDRRIRTLIAKTTTGKMMLDAVLMSWTRWPRDMRSTG